MASHKSQALTFRLVRLATILAIMFGLYFPAGMLDGAMHFFGVALILAGVPHGATDFFLLQALWGNENQTKWRLSFIGFYLLCMAVYVLLWASLPMVAMMVFLLISAYHFGQSNWPQLQFGCTFLDNLTVFLWGASVIGVPVLLHFEQASIIWKEMTGITIQLDIAHRFAAIFLLVALVIACILHQYQKGTISKRKFSEEVWGFLLLMLLFFTTPLLLGFGIYFIFWHSLSSIADQIEALRKRNTGYSIKNYLMGTVPLTVVAFVGLGIAYQFIGAQYDYGQNLGTLFQFLSVITVPHAFVMEEVYLSGKTSQVNA